MKDIALKAGVSKTAVSLALRNDPQISAEQRKRIQDIAKAMGYVRNPKIGEVMSQMRGSKTHSSHGILAIINCNQNQFAFLDHPTIPNYVQGCKRRAESLGYATDTFWIYEPGMTSNRWISVLKSRGISGIVLVGMMRQNRIPDFFKPVVEQFPATVTGVRTRKPALSFSCADHHMLTLQAFERAIAMGYQRPGIVVEKTIDYLVEQRFTCAYITGQRKYLPPEYHLEAFVEYDEAKDNRSLFEAWLNRERPDVILTLFKSVEKWVHATGLKVPEDIGLIQLEWQSQHPHWAGMDQHNDICGEAAVDMAINLIYNGEIGFPAFPRATLIGSSWVDGQTVKQQESPLSGAVFPIR